MIVLIVFGFLLKAINLILGNVEALHTLQSYMLYDKNRINVTNFDAIELFRSRKKLLRQARLDAKKRPSIYWTNFCMLIFLVFVYSLMPLTIPSLSRLGIVGVLAFVFVYLLLDLCFLFAFICLIMNTSSLPAAYRKFINRKYTKKSLKKGFYLAYFKAVDVASHFDKYILIDADSYDVYLKDSVIGAINIESNINNYISNIPPEENVVIFIYSRYGDNSYLMVNDARKYYDHVFDLGSICGDMRKLEQVAHQLFYLQDCKCLNVSAL